MSLSLNIFSRPPIFATLFLVVAKTPNTKTKRRPFLQWFHRFVAICLACAAPHPRMTTQHVYPTERPGSLLVTKFMLIYTVVSLTGLNTWRGGFAFFCICCANTSLTYRFVRLLPLPKVVVIHVWNERVQ